MKDGDNIRLEKQNKRIRETENTLGEPQKSEMSAQWWNIPEQIRLIRQRFTP